MNVREVVDKMKALLMAETEAESAFVFAAGQEVKIEAGRSGTFKAMGGQSVTLTPEIFEGMAARFSGDGEADHKLKVGHGPILSDTPDFGDVTRIEYDRTADRLFAFAVPTPAAVEKNQKEGFKRCSMELSKVEDGFNFDHLSLLGARRPAISGLATIALASPDGYEEATEERPPTEPDDPEDVTLFAIPAATRDRIPSEDFAGPGQTFPIRNQEDVIHAAELLHHAADPSAVKAKIISIARRKGLQLPATWKQGLDKGAMTSNVKTNAAAAEEPKAEEKVEMSTANARLLKQVKDSAKRTVSAFLAENVKRIPVGLKTAGIEAGLVAMLEAEADAAAAEKSFEFASAPGKEAGPASEFVFAMLAALPEQVTAKEEAETATETKAAKDPEPANMAEFEGMEQGSVEYHLAIEKEIADAKAAGETITYLAGVQRVERKRAR